MMRDKELWKLIGVLFGIAVVVLGSLGYLWYLAIKAWG